MFEKIISGGQTGADLAGLWAAKSFGIETGGVAASKFWTELGSQPAMGYTFNVKDMNLSYAKRTQHNIQMSDATLCFSFIKSAGTRLTLASAKEDKQPHLLVDLSQPKQLNVQQILNFIDKYPDIKVLNIAGNSQSRHRKDVFVHTYDTLEQVLISLGFSSEVSYRHKSNQWV